MNFSLLIPSLLAIYKLFFRPHFSDDGDGIHDQPNNSSLSDKIESDQYKVVLPINATAIKRTLKENLYHGLVLLFYYL